jgi:hypothetical protein
LRAALFATFDVVAIHDANFEPFADKAKQTLVSDTVLEKSHHPIVIHCIKESLDIRVQYPAYPLLVDACADSVQRIVLALSAFGIILRRAGLAL